jgi:hypothetical protein
MFASQLNAEQNKWDMVGNNDGAQVQLLDPSQFEQVEKPVDGFGDESVNPFPAPRRYGGTGPDNETSANRTGGEGDFFNAQNDDFAFGNSNWGGEQANDGNDGFGEFEDHKMKGEKITEFQEDAEELAIIEAAQRDQQERLRRARDKEDQEMNEKRQKKQKAQEELNEWYRQRDAKIQNRRKNNKEEEWAYLKTREEHKKSKNPWEKIIDNVEIDSKKYLGTKDVSRMRQAMISRRQDLKKQK